MQIKYYAYFDSHNEKSEFIEILRTSKSKIEALGKLVNKYPNISPSMLEGTVENFKKFINQNETK